MIAILQTMALVFNSPASARHSLRRRPATGAAASLQGVGKLQALAATIHGTHADAAGSLSMDSGEAPPHPALTS